VYPTIKITLPLRDAEIQGVAVIRPKKFIICVPSQIGCPIQCKFCKAKMFERNLTTNEIQRLINYLLRFNTEKKPVLLSFMGVGEPSLNLDTVEKVIKANKFAKYAISTCGYDPMIYKADPKIKIQVSLNAPTEKIRAALMPKAPSLKLTLERTKTFLINYDLNYVLIEDVNDRDEDASDLVALLKEYQFFRIKINRYNETGDFFPSKRTSKFIRVLERAGIEVEYYETDGREIQAACGQLV